VVSDTSDLCCMIRSQSQSSLEKARQVPRTALSSMLCPRLTGTQSRAQGLDQGTGDLLSDDRCTESHQVQLCSTPQGHKSPFSAICWSPAYACIAVLCPVPAVPHGSTTTTRNTSQAGAFAACGPCITPFSTQWVLRASSDPVCGRHTIQRHTWHVDSCGWLVPCHTLW
jgi:hypothetical protein